MAIELAERSNYLIDQSVNYRLNQAVNQGKDLRTHNKTNHLQLELMDHRHSKQSASGSAGATLSSYVQLTRLRSGPESWGHLAARSRL